MESPVRICLSIIVVVHLLLLSSVPARSNAIPLRNGTAEASKDKIKISRFSRFNNATLAKPNVEDVALNELKPKETGSSEETDPKSSKYKDRGRIKFHSYLTSTTETPIKRIVKPTPETKVIIVTPTPEQKNLSQIIDSMREYKKTKIPPLVVSSTTPTTVDLKESSSDEDDMYEDDEEFSKFVSGNFHDSNFFTIPGFTDDEFSQGSKANDNYNKDYSVPPYEKFSSYFPKDMSYSPKRDKYESDSFFRDFEDALTTPKNDFFDKKFHEITSSILNNLNSIRAQTPEPNATSVHKIVKENVGLERLLSNGSPNNKSMVIIKNTKEVRLLDDDKAGSAQKELSDVHGTSIYYEMSVLSTETYTIHNDDDCDNDTLPFEPTKSTSFEEEKASLKSTAPALLPLESKPVFVSSTPSPQILTTSVSSTGSPLKNDVEFISTYHTTPKVSSFTIRQRGYPKSINFPSKKETSNSVTVRNDELSSNRNIKPVNNRRIQFTTPRNKPVWMAPRRNITRPKPNRPTTIYSEYFNIKDKFNSKLPNRTSVLTTASSDIDPVFQSDVVGSKKVVHSQSISDNSIPGLRKRGSAKFSTSATSTQNSTEEEDSTRNMEIPPSSAAWALAGMRNPPSLTSTLADRTIPVRKPDENELQNVAEETVSEKIKTTPDVATPTNGDSNTEVTSKKIYEMDQNKLPWRPVTTPSSAIVESDTKQSVTASKIESYPAESNVSVHGSSMQIEKSTTGVAIAEDTTTTSATKDTTTTPEWVPVTSEEFDRVTTNDKEISSNHIHPLTTNNASAFESITKLPSDLTTPQSDDISSFTVGLSTQKVFDNTVTLPSTMPIDIGDEITTIRFSYVPTVKEVITKVTEFTETTPTWHPVKPSHTRTTYVPEDNTPITTYRPKYVTTTEKMEETTNVSKYPTSADKDEETTTTIQESSSPQQLVSNSETQVTTFQTNVSSFTEDTTSATEIVTEISVESTPNPEETTTIIVEVVTEINTERETPMKFGKSTLSTSQETTVEDISTEADFITLSSSEISEQSSSSNEFMTESNEQKFSEFVHKFTTPFRFETTMEQKYDDTTTRRLETTTMPTIKPTEPIKQQTTIEEERTKPMMPPTEATKSIPKVTTDKEEYIDTPEEEITTRSVTNLDDMLSYGEQTTEASTIFIEDAGSGAPVAIAVSTIGVLALMMLVGLLLVVRRRGRRGVYAQRCTPVSLDAYSLDSVSVGLRKGNPRLRASKRSYGNPAYDDEQVTSHPMQYAALANFALDTDSMTTEFSEIPSVTVRPEEVPLGCEDKNRYSNVLPLPETRVPLTRIGNDPTTEYINANYITGPGNIKNYYIACQAPLANTVSDFWRMIWEQNSRLIVMLTEYMENGVEKCYEYLPPSEITDNRRTFGNFQILLKKREQRDKYAMSTVQLTNLSTRTWREVTHLWYFWPAKGVPDDHDSIIDFMSEMRTYMKISQTAKEYDEDGLEVIYGNEGRSSFGSLGRLKSDESAGNGVNVYSPQKAEEMMRRANNGTLGRMKTAADGEGVRPCVVVCASGAGRSAALVALDVCARALAAGRVDVPRVVREIRAQRPHSLANRHHYIFLYKVLSEYGNKLMGGGVENI